MPILEPQRIRLSRALWLAAFPHGPTEMDWEVADHRERRDIENLVPAAKEEWTAAGQDANDLRLFEASMFRLDKGYSLLQARRHQFQIDGTRIGPAPALTELMVKAAARLKKDDEQSAAMSKAEDELLYAGYGGFVRFYGEPDNGSVTELREIDPSFFRLPRLVFAEFDFQNRLAADPHDEKQKGHHGFNDVEVDLASFKTWMVACERWSADSIPVHLYGFGRGAAPQEPESAGDTALTDKEAGQAAPEPDPFPVAREPPTEWLSGYLDQYCADHDGEPPSKEHAVGLLRKRYSWLGRRRAREVAASFAPRFPDKWRVGRPKRPA